MASLIGRLAAHERSVSDANAAPQTLSEKLAQELGSQSNGPPRLTPAAQRPRQPDNSAPSGTVATNSPQASGRHGFYLDADEEGEERMPIPSTWKVPSPAVMPAGWLARQLKAGLLGLALGLAAVIPTVLWLTGRLDAQIPFLESTEDRTSIAREAAATGSLAPTLAVPPKAAERSVMPAKAETEKAEDTALAQELLSRAQGFIADGNMLRAREILSEAALADNPSAAFALAETFDPNILAATGAQGTKAEVERARMLYGKALAGGIVAARRRLDALN